MKTNDVFMFPAGFLLTMINMTTTNMRALQMKECEMIDAYSICVTQRAVLIFRVFFPF